MTKRNKEFSIPKNQSGIALAISIVFLLIISIVGITSIQGTTSEQRMTNNLQNVLHSFHYAESGIATAVKDPNIISTQYQVGSELQHYLCTTSGGAEQNCSDTGAGTAKTKSHYVGVGTKPPVNYSIDSGFASHFFQISSSGYVGKASSTHRQGVYVVGPAGHQ